MERDSAPTAAYPSSRGPSNRVGADRPPGNTGLVDEAINEVRSATSDVWELAGALREHCDHTLGAAPSGGANGAKSPDSPVRADQLRSSFGQLRNAITELREQVARARNI